VQNSLLDCLNKAEKSESFKTAGIGIQSTLFKKIADKEESAASE
jgi:hypothetical protein